MDLPTKLQEDEGRHDHNACVPPTQAARLRRCLGATIPSRQKDARLRQVRSVADATARWPPGRNAFEANVPELAGVDDFEEIPALRVATAAIADNHCNGFEETAEVLGPGPEMDGQLFVDRGGELKLLVV